MTQPVGHLQGLQLLSSTEKSSFLHAAGPVWESPAGATIRGPEDQSGECQLLLRGFAARYKESLGVPRQITTFNVAGDFCDLHGMFFAETNFFVRALTPCVLQRFSHLALLKAMNENPNLAKLLWQRSLIDAAIEREWLVNIGRRSELERTAHLLCELLVRMEASDVDNAARTVLPIPSEELASAQAMTTADADAVLAELTERGLIEVYDGTITVIADAELREVGLFDQNYLEC